MEYVAPVWNPHLIKNVKKLEKSAEVCNKTSPSEEGLEQLNLTTLEDKRTRSNIIMTYKILRGTDRSGQGTSERWVTGTRGHSWKLKTQTSHKDTGKYSTSLALERSGS